MPAVIPPPPPATPPPVPAAAPEAASWLERIRALLASDRLSSPWVEALVVLAVSLLLAWVVDRLLSRWLVRWARRSRSDLDDRLLAILRGPLRNSVLLIGLAVCAQVLPLGATLERHTLNLLQTLAIVIWLAFALRLSSLVLAVLTEHKDRYQIIDARTLPLFDNLAKVLLAGAGVYFLFLAWDIDVTAWLASAGIIGIAVGFAAKDTLANLFSGLFISADAPYKVGDFIVLDSGERGRVTHVGIRSTRLLTRDDIEITVPNAVIAAAKIVNESGGPWEKERLRVKVAVAYGSDLDQVRAALMAVAAGESHVCPEPAPRVRFRSFGDSGLDFELLCWIDEPVLRGRTLDALNTAVYERFQADGIEIPYPKRDVYVRHLPSAEKG